MTEIRVIIDGEEQPVGETLKTFFADFIHKDEKKARREKQRLNDGRLVVAAKPLARIHKTGALPVGEIYTETRLFLEGLPDDIRELVEAQP